MSFPTPINGPHDHGTEQEARLSARLSALARLSEVAEGRLPDELLDGSRRVLARAAGRMRVAPSHTAIVMTGPPGSGTSSLFNAVVGLRLSEEAPRRFATPPGPMACVWDEAGAAPLLDVLGIPANRRAVRHGPLDATTPPDMDMPSGLVLVDVPGDDPAIARDADHVVWVVDATSPALLEPPGQVARAAARPDATVTLVVNKIDAAPHVLLPHGLPYLRVSARTGEGLGSLRAVIAHAARGGAARRLSADVDEQSARFDVHFAGRVPEPGGDAVRADLVERLAAAVEVDAVASGERSQARRLPDEEAATLVRRTVDALTGEMPEVWAQAVRDGVGEVAWRLPGALETELAEPAPDARRPSRLFRHASRKYEEELGAQLRATIGAVADALVLKPAEEEIGRYREAHALYVASREPLHRG